jgi:hypothetical protein
MNYQNAEFHNVEELIEDQNYGGFRILRIPQSTLYKLNPGAQKTAFFSCGCELRFNLHSEEAIIYLRRDPCGPDIMPYGITEIWQGDYQGRYQMSPQPVGQEKTAIRVRKMKTDDIKLLQNQKVELFDPDLYRVFIPYDWGHAIYGIEGDISLPEKGQTPDKTLLCYGSSITHGGGVTVPTANYAFRLAGKLGMDLRNLGLAGSAWMDEAMADYICQQDWAAATLELGINVVKWPLDEFEKKARIFINKIAAAHPDRPVYCISLFTSIEDFKQKEHVQGMRKAIQKIVEELDSPMFYYIDGEKCLTNLTGLASDAIHPSNTGMDEITQYLYRHIAAQHPLK